MPKYIRSIKDAYLEAYIAEDEIGMFMLFNELESMGCKPYTDLFCNY